MTTHNQNRRPAHHFYAALKNWKQAAIDVEAVCPDDNEEVYEAEVDRLADVAGELADAVFKYRSPDLAAVIAKLEIAINTPEFIQAEHIRNAIADLAELANVEKSPAFVPTVWLCQFERRGGYFDYDGASDKITLRANYDQPAALAMVNELTNIEREALVASIIGKKGGAA